MIVELWFPFPPVAKQRARLTRRRRGKQNFAYTPQATKHFEDMVAQEAAKVFADNPTFGNKPVVVEIEIEKEGFKVTISHAEQSVRPVGLRGDIDNYVKSIFDGLNGVAWDDDRQVELLEVSFIGEPRKGSQYTE